MNMDRLNKGLYWDRAWKLVEGCTKVSAGCDHCWSETETALRAGHPNPTIGERAYSVVAHSAEDGGKYSFSGHILLREDNLGLPLRTKKPTVWAVWNDLYHADVPDAFRDRAYAMMALCPQHTFLVLTKRAQGMAEYFAEGSIHCWDRSIDALPNAGNITVENTHLDCVRDSCDEFVTVAKNWPLPNVWHGVTAENQAAADKRIPHLLRVPGKRFLSIEPMLGAVDISGYLYRPSDQIRASGFYLGGVESVLLGGESGKDARPMHPNWARSVRDQCAAAGVSFYFKQWGEYAPNWLNDDDGNKIPGSEWIDPMGKRLAGRVLDGRTHDDLPWASERKAVA